MKHPLNMILGASMSVIGAASALPGAFLLIAARQDSFRISAGTLLFLGGAVLFLAGIRLRNRALRADPGAIRKTLLRMAGKNRGEVPEEAIIGRLGRSEIVTNQIREFVNGGTAREESREGRSVLVFPGFGADVTGKKCPHCGGAYPVSEVVERCPACGGDVKGDQNLIAGKENRSFPDDEGTKPC